MDRERLMLQGRLAEAKKRLREMGLKADSYIIVLREIFDPLESDFTKLELERAKAVLKDFIKLQRQARGLKEEIRKLRERLGEEDE